MTTNFEIENHRELIFKEKVVDLHNNFDLVGYEYTLAGRQLKLTWAKSKGNWVGENEFSKLVLIHSNVFFLRVEYDNEDYEFPADDKCLAGVSFSSSEERDINDSFTTQNKPDNKNDILYFFETEYFIRVGCDRVELIAE